MTLQHILLFGAAASFLLLIPIIRFANRTVKIREVWDAALDINRINRKR